MTLPDDLRTRFNTEGYYSPLRAVPAAQAHAIQMDLERLEREHGADVWTRTKLKPHLLIKSINHLMRTPEILDAVGRVLGPDLMVWGVGIFAKAPRSDSFFSWHQDSTYWGLSEPALATAWIALTPSNAENGCMRVVPGSHREAQIPHREISVTGNLLSRGQEVAVEVKEEDAVDLVLAPGQMSLHHVMAVHGSNPNGADYPRIGIGIRYIAAHVGHAPGFRDSATLVRGEDHYGHYVLEPKPRQDFDPICVALYDEMVVQARRRATQEAVRINVSKTP